MIAGSAFEAPTLVACLDDIAVVGQPIEQRGEVSAERRLADLESTLALVKLDPVENAALLAPLLDIPLPQERTLTLAPAVPFEAFHLLPHH